MSDKNAEENVVKNWGEMQQKLLNDWLETLRRLGGTPTLELWRKTVDTWQSSVKETIDGGEWIGGAGEFNKLSELTSQEWDEIAALTRGKKEGGEGPNAN